jgi:hypothetical protein
MTIQTIPDDTKPFSPAMDDEFTRYAESLPENANTLLEKDEPELEQELGDTDSTLESVGIFSGVEPSDEPVTPKRRKSLKKLQKTMGRIQGKMSKFPILWFDEKARENPAWKLDDDEKELIEDSVATVFELIEVNVDVEPIVFTLRSVYWVLLYPLFAFCFLFLIKKSKEMNIDAVPPEEKP